MVVWIAIAGLCVKLAQGRDRNSLPLIAYSHSYRANPQEHNSETQLSHILSLLPGAEAMYHNSSLQQLDYCKSKLLNNEVFHQQEL